MRSTTDQRSRFLRSFTAGLIPFLLLTPPSFGQSNEPFEEIEAEPMARGPVHEAFAEPIDFDQEQVFLVPKAPPTAIEELPPDGKPEGEGVVWIPGYWSWDDDRSDFIWVSGVWRYTPVGREWVAGQWQAEGDKYRWIPGYWAPTTGNGPAQVNRVPMPPASLESGPNREAPSDDHFWIPGTWQYRSDRYVWRPGFWSVCHDDWVWVPDHYIPLGRQCAYVPGYWDYGWEQRGVLYAPCYIDYRRYVGRRYAYRPQIAINTVGAFLHLWVRPSYRHYYFGDYYDSRYVGFGIRPWYSYHRPFYRAYDPLFVHYNWRYGRDRISLHRQFRGHHNHYRRNVAARPSRSFHRGGKSRGRGHAHAQLAFRASELGRRHAGVNRRKGLRQAVISGGRGAQVVRNGARDQRGPGSQRAGRGRAAGAGRSPVARSGRAAAQARNATQAARTRKAQRDAAIARNAAQARNAARARGRSQRDNAAARNPATQARVQDRAKGALVGKAKAKVPSQRRGNAAARIEALSKNRQQPQAQARQGINGGTRSRLATGATDRPAYNNRQSGRRRVTNQNAAPARNRNGRGASGIARNLSERSSARPASSAPGRRSGTRANQRPAANAGRPQVTSRAKVVVPDVNARRSRGGNSGRSNAARAAAANALQRATASQKRPRATPNRQAANRSTVNRPSSARSTPRSRPAPRNARPAPRSTPRPTARATASQRSRPISARPASNRTSRPSRPASVTRQSSPRPRASRPAARQQSRPQQMRRAMSRKTMPQRGGGRSRGGNGRRGGR